MQFQFLTLALAVLAVANPVPEPEAEAAAAAAPKLCTGGDQAFCCSFSLGSIINATCQKPGPKIKTLKQFKKHCQSKGNTAQCCDSGLDGITLLCSPA